MEFVIGVMLLIFDAVAVMHVLCRSCSVTKKILWILLILFLPVMGMLLYFLLEVNVKTAV
jgi:hypothetical protein